MMLISCAAYDGTFCEKDRNGCLEASCYTGVQCYDVPAPGVGITCGPCPIGYSGDGTDCTGWGLFVIWNIYVLISRM